MDQQQSAHPTKPLVPATAQRPPIPKSEEYKPKAAPIATTNGPKQLASLGDQARAQNVLPPEYALVEPATKPGYRVIGSSEPQPTKPPAKVGEISTPNKRRLIPMVRPRTKMGNSDMVATSPLGRTRATGTGDPRGVYDVSGQHLNKPHKRNISPQLERFKKLHPVHYRELMINMGGMPGHREPASSGVSAPAPGGGSWSRAEMEKQKLLAQRKKLAEEYRIRERPPGIMGDPEDYRLRVDEPGMAEIRRQQMLREQLRRKESTREMMANAQLRKYIEAEAASFGDLCTRMDCRDRNEDRRKMLEYRGMPARGGAYNGAPPAGYDNQGGYGGFEGRTAERAPPNPEYGRHAGSGYHTGARGPPPAARGRPVQHDGREPMNDNRGPWIPPSTNATRLQTVELAVEDVDDRQLVAKEVGHCKANTRSLLHTSKEVLILAESDFSFSAGLVEFVAENSHVVATSFESEEKLQDFHKEKLFSNLKILHDHNATVLHEVDCTALEHTLDKAIRAKGPDQESLIRTRWSGHFDLVWLQLPHTGGTAKTNSNMIQKFLTSVGRVLKPNGLVFLTLYGMQVDHWKVAQHAQIAQMAPVLKIPFNTSIYPAIWTQYNPKVGFSNGFFDILRHPCDTFVFAQNEFTCVSKLKAVDTKILSGLRTVKINTISDLAEADKRLLSDDVDPKFIRLIRQAKAWLIVWTELPDIIRAINPFNRGDNAGNDGQRNHYQQNMGHAPNRYAGHHEGGQPARGYHAGGHYSGHPKHHGAPMANGNAGYY